MLLFVLECGLGIIAVVLVAALAHWFGWLLPVALLLYLLIVLPTALLCGFWQALVVSLSAVVVHGIFTAREPELSLAKDPANSVTLLVFVLVALVVSRLSARVTGHAREAESWGGQMHDLYEFTRRTLQMNLHVEPGPQLAELVHEIFSLEAVAVFDADLHDVYHAGYWSVDPQEIAQNVYYFETSDDDPETGVGRRVVRLGTVPIGSLVVRGDTSRPVQEGTTLPRHVSGEARDGCPSGSSKSKDSPRAAGLPRAVVPLQHGCARRRGGPRFGW